MDNELKNRIEHYVETVRLVKSEIKALPSLVRFFLGCCISKDEDNIKKINEIKQFIKNNSPWYSYFRGRANIHLLSSILINESLYKSLFNDIFGIYPQLKPATTFGSPFLLYSSFVIAKGDEKKDVLISKTINYYKAIRNKHSFITSPYDIVSASFLASFDQFQNIDEIEECYNNLRNEGFSTSSGTYSLAQILMLNKNEYPSATNWRLIARETRSMYHHLRERKTKVNYYALPLLGLAPLIDMSNKTLASEIVEVSNYLAEFKDVFGFWKCSKANRTLIAIALCYSYYFETRSINHPVMTNQLLLKIMMASIITKKIQDEAAMAAA
jgi:hypothetical protein